MSARKHYAIYDVATGEILRTVLTRNPGQQCEMGQSFVEGEADDRFTRIVNGELVEIPGAVAAWDAAVAAEKQLSKERREARKDKVKRLRELRDSAPEAVQILLDLELERAE
jgi:hypothetical protein